MLLRCPPAAIGDPPAPVPCRREVEVRLELAAKAFRVKPNVPQIIDTLGYALLKNGETENSIVFLEKASNMLPDEAAIQLHLGQAYKAAGRYDEAVASLTSIREKGASESELKTAEALLKEMK